MDLNPWPDAHHAGCGSVGRRRSSYAACVNRIVVVGGTGSGKTTLATALSARLGHTHIELDGLWWQQDWAHVAPEELAHTLRASLANLDNWVVDGNYLDQIDGALLWQEADTLVWLDLPRHICYRRAVFRTVRRILTRAPLWNGNRQNIAVLSPQSLIALWRLWPTYSSAIRQRLDSGEFGHLNVVRLPTAAAVAGWISTAAA